ncbi:MAG: hypothetical protein COX57_02150 [Alphaproteobacteria bacterium CG_4_10_14_0_2_um_filter_63_37]|nr:MAG: hypothetical protein AUJ55_06690 [Proteobacteria bacterium CG1_02_64_396]PJA25663.1 MAG: hypothetical protein COX57_02150 [Alphaproteobacteria bacterium CG_4_10_14_0_2_um_filter_63_37]
MNQIADLGPLVTLIALWSGVLFWAVKWLLDRYVKHIDGKLDGIQKANREGGDKIDRVEKDLLKLQAELPREYVRREDWIRFSSSIDAKLDHLRDKLDRVLEAKPHARD